MSDYISKEVVINSLDKLCDRVCQYSKVQRSVMCGACPLGDAFDVIEELPVADVVEVVRCGDCEYVEPSKGRNKDKLPYFCTIHREKFYDQTEYCSFGRHFDE